MKASDAAMIAALGVAQIVSWGTVYYSFPLFVLPMGASLDWSLTLLNGAATAGLLVTGACAYPVGAIIDRHGGRYVMTAGSAGVALLLVGWSFVSSPVAFYLVWIGLGVMMAAVLYEPVFAVLTQHFGAGARRAITSLTLIAGFAGTVFIPLTETLLARLEWRSVLWLLACLNVAICVPVHWYLLPHRPPASAPDPAQEASSRPFLLSLGERFRDPVFVGLTVWFTAWATTASGVMFQLVPLLKARGVDGAIIVAAAALVGPSQVAGRVVMMAFGEHARIAVTGAVTTALMPAAVLILLLAPSRLSWLALFAAVFGIANGITTILRGVAPAEWIGRDNYGRTMGAMGAPMMVAAALAPLLTAWLWTWTGELDAMLWAVLGVSLVAAAGFWFALGKHRDPLYRKKETIETHG